MCLFTCRIHYYVPTEMDARNFNNYNCTLYGKETECSPAASMLVLYMVMISLFSMKCWFKAKFLMCPRNC